MARVKLAPGEAKAGRFKAVIHMDPSRIAQAATDLACKTILGSVIEIESVGEVGVCRVLQEVWKRGGGEIVSFHCLTLFISGHFARPLVEHHHGFVSPNFPDDLRSHFPSFNPSSSSSATALQLDSALMGTSSVLRTAR